jgi:hypothetical protein
MPASAALLLEQFSRNPSTTGWVPVIGFLILLLLGGIALLVHSVIDYGREHKAPKREEKRTDRKAA